MRNFVSWHGKLLGTSLAKTWGSIRFHLRFAGFFRFFPQIAALSCFCNVLLKVWLGGSSNVGCPHNSPKIAGKTTAGVGGTHECRGKAVVFLPRIALFNVSNMPGPSISRNGIRH